MSSPLKLSMLITADATGVAPATSEARAAVDKLTTAVNQNTPMMEAMAAASDEAAASAKRFTQAITGRTSAEVALRASMGATNNATVLASRSTALAAHEVTNLSYQLSDIAVMLAAGQSPFMLMMQQGTQVSQIMGSRGLGSLLPAIGTGLMSLLTPTTAALAGITALGYGASYIFAAMRGDAENVGKTLEEQEELIRKVARQWGAASPAIKAYNDELERTKNLNDLIAAKQLLIDKEYAGPKAALPDLGAAVGDITDIFQRLSVAPEAINAVQKEFAELEAKIGKGVATGQDAIDIQKLLTQGFQAGQPDIRRYADEFGRLAEQLDAVSKNSEKIRFDALGGVLHGIDTKGNRTTSVLPGLNPLDGFNQTPFQTQEDFWRDRQRRLDQERENKRLGAMVPIPTPRPNREDSLPSVYDFLQTQDRQLEKLRLEAQLIGTTEAVRARAMAQLEAEQEIRQRGIDVQGEEANSLRENAASIADATTELKRHADAWGKVQSAGESAIDSVVGKLSKGDLSGALSSAAEEFNKFILQMSVANPLKNALFGTNHGTLGDLGGGSLGILGKLFGGSETDATSSIAGQTFGSVCVTADLVQIDFNEETFA